MADRRDPTGEVLEAMRAAGCEPADPGAIAFDGRLHRYDVAGDKKGRKNGWFALHDGIVPHGAFGSWKTGVEESWRGSETASTARTSRTLPCSMALSCSVRALSFCK